MQEQYFMIIIQPHQFFAMQDGLLHYGLKKRGAMPDFQYGKAGFPEIEHGCGSFVKDLLRQNGWTRIKIMYHSLFDLGTQFTLKA